MLVVLQFGFLLALLFIPNSPLLIKSTLIDVLGASLYGLALVIFIFAYAALKPSLRVSPIPREGAPLITSGIYAHVRHPMYLAVSFVGTGLTVRKMTILSIAIWLLLIATLFVKSRYEDSLLSHVHLEAKNYQSKTRGIKLTKSHE